MKKTITFTVGILAILFVVWDKNKFENEHSGNGVKRRIINDGNISNITRNSPQTYNNCSIILKREIDTKAILEELKKECDLKISFNPSLINLLDIQKFIESLTEEEIIALLKEKDDDLLKGNWPFLAKLGFLKLGRLAPRKALEELRGVLNYADFMQHFYEGWAQKNSYEALENLLEEPTQNFDSSLSSYYLIFKEMAGQSLEQSLEALKKTSNFEKHISYKAIATQIRNESDFCNFFDKLSQDPDKIMITGHVISTLIESEPIQKIEWAERNNINIISSLENAWLDNDPSQASEWLFNRSEDKQMAVEKIVQHWNDNQKEKLGEWVKGLASNLKNYGYASLVERFSYTPDYAITMLEKIPNPKVQSNSAVKLYKEIKKSSTLKADAFFKVYRNLFPQNFKQYNTYEDNSVQK